MGTFAVLRSVRHWKLLVGGAFLVSMGLLGSVSQAQAVSFGPATNFAAGTNPRSVAIGDLNGDGKPDIATANRTNNTSRDCQTCPCTSGSQCAGIYASQW